MLEQVGLSTRLLGLGLGLSLFCIGAGAIHWAKTLMPDDEIVAERKPMRSSDEDRAEAVAAMKEGRCRCGLGPAQADPQQPARRARPARPARHHPAARPRHRCPAPPRLHRVAAGQAAVDRPHRSPIKAEDVPIGRRHPRAARAASTRCREHASTKRQGDHDRHPAGAGRHHRPGAEGLGRQRHRRLLQGLHARRLPGRPVRAADAPPALPVPPVDVRRDEGLRGDLRPGGAPPAPAADHRRRARATSCPATTSRSRSARASGSEGER